MNNKNYFDRLISLYGTDKILKLQNSSIAVIGLGGVGSFCSTALARSAIGQLVLIDYDKIESSNINRQEFANTLTIGTAKVDVAEKYIRNINPDIKLKTFCIKVTEENIPYKLNKVNYIIDAIDDIPAKIILAKFAEQNNIPIISCMGTAKRKNPFKFQFCDIYKTTMCPLCKSFRKKAREAGIKKLEVLYSTEQAVVTYDNKLGSTSYIPPIAGMMLAGKVIENL